MLSSVLPILFANSIKNFGFADGGYYAGLHQEDQRTFKSTKENHQSVLVSLYFAAVG
jgi:hypothetical protein